MSIMIDFFAVMKLIKELERKNLGIWRDMYRTIFLFRDGAIKNIITNIKGDSNTVCCFLTPLLKDFLTVNAGIYPKNVHLIISVISIGGAKEHNDAREFIFEHLRSRKVSFIAIPFPLSNDSFCTNRSKKKFDDINIPSRETVYPTHVIVDVDALLGLPYERNLVGVGEILGLIFSMNDYMHSRKIVIAPDVIAFVEKFIADLLRLAPRKTRSSIRNIALGLMMKCLIMRVAGTNHIGALGDHMLAYALDAKLREHNIYLSHGQLVYLGSVLMAKLFPDWIASESLKAEKLIVAGLRLGILNIDIVRKILGLLNFGLVRSAIKIRPNRLSSLATLGEMEVSKKFSELSDFINQTCV